MVASDVLKGFRQGNYDAENMGKKEEGSKEMGGGGRTIQLTDEEAQELQGYAKSEGEEQTCEVTGRLGPDKSFTVNSVHLPAGAMPDEKGMAAEVMGRAPMMQNQTMPSPS